MRLVVCLYEQAISDLRRAAWALENGDIEARTREINHALLVIAQLQGSLEMDRGGGVARNLQRFYNVIRNGLTEAQSRQSARILEQQISLLVLVHEAWQEVERTTPISALPATESRRLNPIMNSPSSPENSAEWNA